jgi:hypothetical protein
MKMERKPRVGTSFFEEALANTEINSDVRVCLLVL